MKSFKDSGYCTVEQSSLFDLLWKLVQTYRLDQVSDFEELSARALEEGCKRFLNQATGFLKLVSHDEAENLFHLVTWEYLLAVLFL